jgi:cytochrome c553
MALTGFVTARPALSDGADGLARTCNGCHGPDGHSATATMPSLAGLDSRYLASALQHYADGTRKNYLMGIVARGLAGDDIAALAQLFSARTFDATPLHSDALRVARGESAAAPCRACHGDAMQGGAEAPRIAGQPAAYLLRAMQDYRDGRRQAPEAAMRELKALDDETLADLANYLAGLD